MANSAGNMQGKEREVVCPSRRTTVPFSGCSCSTWISASLYPPVYSMVASVPLLDRSFDSGQPFSFGRSYNQARCALQAHPSASKESLQVLIPSSAGRACNAIRTRDTWSRRLSCAVAFVTPMLLAPLSERRGIKPHEALFSICVSASQIDGNTHW